MTYRKTLLIAALSLGLASPVLGQQAAGGNGRALDANNQVGSGGNNSQANQIDYRLRNNLVTGNVSGGSGFQGDVGYRAPGEFQGDLGSDTLFNFRARSFNSAPTRLNNAAQPSVNLSSSSTYGGAPIYRSYTNLAGQSLTGGGGSSYDYNLYSEGGSAVLSAPGASTTYAERVKQGQLGHGGPLGAVYTTDGRALQVTDSPLLGIRQAPRQPAPTQPEISEEQLKKIDEENKALDASARVDMRLYPTPTEPTPAQAEAQENQVIALAPTVILGRKLEPRRAGDEAPSALNTDREEARTQKLRDSIFNQKPVEGQSVYNDLMQQVREADTDDDSPSWDPKIDIEEPDAPLVRDAEAAALAAFRKLYGLETTDDEAAELSPQMDEATASLLDDLNYNLPEIESLVGSEPTRAAEFIRQAEAAMVAGDFFKAENAYRQAELMTPNDPMIRVGITHALMGAGMIRSSALNMRRLFEQHPELIAARYEDRLLPPQDRLRWVQNELNRMAESNTESPEPGLVMAYLGYQINSRQLVRYGLALAQARAPRDPLLPVLRAIWLDESAPSAEGAER